MKLNTTNIKAAMIRQYMTQGALAEKAGVSRQTVCVTLARGTCSIATAAKIAAALNLAPDEACNLEGV